MDLTPFSMLEIKNLHAKVDGKDILKGIDLTVNAGEVHAVMGPNGSGKSTLAHLLAGRDGYTITEGSVTYKGKDLLALAPEARAAEGLFLGFQYPVEIPGVSSMYLLKTAMNAQRKHRGEPEIDAMDFLAWVRDRLAKVKMDIAIAKITTMNEGKVPTSVEFVRLPSLSVTKA